MPNLFFKKATEIFYIPIYDQKNNILTLNILAFMFLAVQSTVEPEIGGEKVDEMPKYYCADPRLVWADVHCLPAFA